MSMLVPREFEFSMALVGTHMTVVETGISTSYVLVKVPGDRWRGIADPVTDRGIQSAILARTYYGEDQAGFPVQVWLS